MMSELSSVVEAYTNSVEDLWAIEKREDNVKFTKEWFDGSAATVNLALTGKGAIVSGEVLVPLETLAGEEFGKMSSRIKAQTLELGELSYLLVDHLQKAQYLLEDEREALNVEKLY